VLSRVVVQAVGLIRVAILRPIVAVLERVGAPVDQLLARAGVPVWTPPDPEMLIPTCCVARLLAEGARTQRVEKLGLVAGERARIDMLGMFGRLVGRSQTLGDALDAIAAEQASFSSSSRMSVEGRGECVVLGQAFAGKFDPGDYGWQQATHYVLMLLTGVVGLAEPGWRPVAIGLQSAESTIVRNARLADAMTFRQPATTIAIPRRLLARPLRMPAFDPRMTHDAIEAWRSFAPAADFVTSIAQAVETLSCEGYPDIHQTAEFVGISVRTLQRQLGEAGITHEELIGRARFATAAAVLEETDLKILEIALDLGYSDHAHFTRAFRRWAGCSPQEYRRRQRQNLRGFNLAS
jgi:AraC-like DNA-binding protein